MCIFKVYPGRRDFKAHGKEETGNGICAISSLLLWRSWWIAMRAVADARRPVQIHFTERLIPETIQVWLLSWMFPLASESDACGQWPQTSPGVLFMHRHSLKIRQRLGDIWTLSLLGCFPCLNSVSTWLPRLPGPACEGSTLESASCINHAHRSPTFRPCFQGSPPGTLAHLGVTASKSVQGKVVTLQLSFIYLFILSFKILV